MQSTLQPINNANQLILRIVSIGDVIVYLLISLAVVYIIWYIVQYFIRSEAVEDRKAAIYNIVWGIVGLAIILSIWGLVNILLGTFNTTANAPRDRFPNADLINNPNSGSVNINSGSSGLLDAPSGYGERYNNAI